MREDVMEQNKAGGASRGSAAERALSEAEHRRKVAQKSEASREIGGRGGPDPARYGDWESKGIAHDF